MNALLFVSTVLIWGTTWIAIAFQVGPATVTVSLFYRFALAALVLLIGLALAGKLRVPALWRFVILQALCLFCFNFIALYHATTLIPSGLVAVIFSLASILNAINARLFFSDRITGRTILAGLVGVTGLVLVFWTELSVDMDAGTVKGIGLAVLGTCFFSWGNMASRRNSADGIPLIIANGWGMGIGTVVLFIILIITGQPLVLPEETSYWVALLYLTLIGTVLGFTTYLMLVARIGSAGAGYATVLFPVVALAASTLLEGYQWTETAVIGVAMTGLGNILMFTKPGRMGTSNPGMPRQ